MIPMMMAAVLIATASICTAQEIRSTTAPAKLEVAPAASRGETRGTAGQEQASALKELHGRVSNMITAIDRQMAGTDKDGAVALSIKKEEMSAALREVEQQITLVSRATDSDRAEVNKNAAAFIENTDAKVLEVRKELGAMGGR